MSMKNKHQAKPITQTIDKIIQLSSAGFLLMIVLLYGLLPSFAVSVNRLLEMTTSGSAKGLMMTYYQYGDLAWAIGGLNRIIQMLSLVMEKSVVMEACNGLFSPISAKAILVVSSLVAVWMAYGIGALLRTGLCLNNRLKNWGEKCFSIAKKYENMSMVLVCLAAFMGQGIGIAILYIIGVLKLDFRKVSAAALIGFLITLI